MANILTKFDQYGAVKFTASLWLIVAYGLRHVYLILFPPTRVAFESYTELFAGKWFLIPDATIVLVILLYTLRQPAASQLIRKLWGFGQWLLASAYALDFGLTVIFNSKALLDQDHTHFNLVFGNLLLDAGVIAFILTSAPIRDVFKSFPDPIITPEEPEVSQRETTTPHSTQEQPSPATQRRRKNPDAILLKEPITLGYEFAEFPFHTHQLSDQILEVRQHLMNANLAAAEKGLRFLLEKDPQNAMLWHELGLVAFSADKLQQAESMILKAMLFESNNYLYWRNLGEIRRRLGDFDTATENARQAIKLMPNDVNAHYNLGLALWDAGKNDEALKAFEQAKTLHPDFVHQTTAN